MNPTFVQTGVKPTLDWGIEYPALFEDLAVVGGSGSILTTQQVEAEIRVNGACFNCGMTNGKELPVAVWVRTHGEGNAWTLIFFGDAFAVDPSQVLFKKWLGVLGLVCVAAVMAAVPSHGAGGNFGLGIIVGEPTGISGKLFVSNTNAVQGALAWSFSGDTDFHLQADYLFHFDSLIPVKKGKAPVFAGMGGRVKFRENNDNQIGIRIPVGIAYHFAAAPFDIFFEIVPILELAPDTEFSLEGAIGGRFYF